MGTKKHLGNVEALFDKSPVVDFTSIERIVGVRKGKSNYAKLLVFHLLKKGDIHRVGKGVYTKHNESSLAVFAFRPAYLGLQSALSFHGLWEQETIPIILTTKKVRRGMRTVLGTNVLVRSIDKKYFFGFSFVKEGNFYLPYSDIEKTFIDLFVFHQKIDASVLRELQQRIDRKKLQKYLMRYPLSLRKKLLSCC